MPKCEKLDNQGNPTGEYKHFSDRVWFKIKRLKNCRWKLAEPEQPKVSHSNPVPMEIKDFPKNKEDQYKWVEETNTIKKLELAIKHTNSLAVKQQIQDKLDKLKSN